MESAGMWKAKILFIFSFVAMFASNARGQSTPGVNDAELKGDYALVFTGMTTGGGGASTPFAAVGRFTADGAGTITNGEVDTNGVGLPEKLIAQAFTGTYQIGADHRGLMTLNIPGGGSLAFVMVANGNAKFAEIDASGGKGTVGSGVMEKADTTAFSTSSIAGDYAFGFSGLDQSNNRAAMAGHVAASGGGMFTDGAVDVNQAGMFTTLNTFVATYMVTDATSGRGMMTFPPAIGGVPQNLNFVFYIENSRKIFAMEMDAVTTATPLLHGSIVRQQTPLGGFTSASLNGGMVTYLTGRAASGCGNGGIPAPNVLVGLLSANSSGGLTLTYDQNCGGVPQSITGIIGAYSVATNGRTAFRIGTNYLVAYLLDSNRAFLLAPDSSVLFGFGDPQAAGTLGNSSVSGAYAGSTTNPATIGVTIFSGEFSANGATPTGSITGTEDIGAPAGPTLDASADSTYAISLMPTNGRGTVTGGIGGNGVLYIISPTKFVMASMNDSNPAILVFE